MRRKSESCLVDVSVCVRGAVDAPSLFSSYLVLYFISPFDPRLLARGSVLEAKKGSPKPNAEKAWAASTTTEEG